MRSTLLAAALALAAAFPAAAQTQPAPSTPAAAPAPASALPSTPARTSRGATGHHGRRTQAERFEAANTTHDGKLTLDQARAGHMNAVVRDFADIDKDNKGYVTESDIRTHRQAVRAAHKAANHS